jgi:Putative  PD-(D/E)XK family member, (DUF4420)
MPECSPWDDIAIPGAELNVRQIRSQTAVPCYWGRDTKGACLFILEIFGDHSEQYRKDAVTVNGISVDLRGADAGQQHLVLTLEKEIDRDLFEGLCRTLVVALEHASDSASSLAVALTHIRRWKMFLSGRGARHLSPEEVRGLFTELIFLQELSTSQDSIAIAVEAWLGPDKSHQDFIYGNTAVEVKSLSGAERSTVRISSEDQLESLNDQLFLRIYRLSILPHAAKARSLNAIVAEIEETIHDSETLANFQRKLVAYGYAPLAEYDEPLFVVSDVCSYRVDNEFPRLVRSRLSAGLARVSYDLELESIAAYECDDAALLRRM